MLGIVAHQSGKLAEAIDHLRRAVALAPDVALYHANLGEMCRLAGHTDEAIAAGRRARRAQSRSTPARSAISASRCSTRASSRRRWSIYDRAVALQDRFRPGAQQSRQCAATPEALRRGRAAPIAAPSSCSRNFADAWNNLGTCLRELKRSEEAEAVYRKALALKPNDPDTLDNLALALKDLERLDEAAELLRRALAIEARSDKFYVHYGSILIDQHKVEEAAAAAERALALNPDNHDVVNLMGRVAFERGELDAALEHYRRALALQAGPRRRLQQYGQCAEGTWAAGGGAGKPISKRSRLDPNVTGVYVNLADSMKFTPGDPHLAAMEALAAKTRRLVEDRPPAARFRARQGLCGSSRTTAARSSTCSPATPPSARRSPMTRQPRLALFDQIEAVFTPELIAAKSGGGDPSRVPIFVLGMPRSGTTLVEQIIASHPHGAWRRRIDRRFNDVVLTVRGPDGKTHSYPDFVPALDGLAAASRSARVISLRPQLLLPARAGEGRASSPTRCRRIIILPASSISRCRMPRSSIPCAIRSTPAFHAFPNCSRREQNHTYDLGELGRYYKRYEQLMAHWRRVLPAGAFLDVRYEDVVADLEGAGAAHHRPLRAALGRSLPRVPRDRPAGPDRQRDASAPADLQERRRPLARLREQLGPLLIALDGAKPRRTAS